MSGEHTMPADHESTGNDEAGTAGPRRSRRAIIGGGLVAAGAGIAGTLLATASPAAAADGDPVVLGASNDETNSTTITSSSGQPVFVAYDNSTDNPGGSAAIYGQSGSSPGVFGLSNGNSGVVGIGTSSGLNGVFAQATNADGVYGQLDQSTTTLGIAAVFGFDPTAAPGNTGVFGQSFNGTGVLGIAGVTAAPDASGVSGLVQSDGGNGVGAFDSSPDGGYGLLAITNNGIAVSANVSGETNGNAFALQVNGPSQFVTAGTAVVPRGKSSVTVAVDWVTPQSFVLATLQSRAPGHYVEAAVAGNGSVTIYLNLPVLVDRAVGYFAIVPNSVTPPAASRRPALPRILSRMARRRPVAPPKPAT